MVGEVSLPVSLSGYQVTHTFFVVNGLMVEGLLEVDFLEKHKAVIAFAEQQNTPKHLMLGRCLTVVQGGQVTLEFTNTSPGPVTLPQGLKVVSLLLWKSSKLWKSHQ